MNGHLIAYIVMALVILYLANSLIVKKSTAGAPAAPSGTWTVYGTNGCGWTRKQLEVMDTKGVAYKFINCDSENCDGVSGFPTLVDPNGKRTVGFSSTLE